MTANLPRTSNDEVAAAAARLTGTPTEMAKRLRALLDEGAPWAGPRESADARREREADAVQYERTIAALQHRLAADFAAARGWKTTTAPLSTRAISRRAGAGTKWHLAAQEWSAYLPQPTFYRTAIDNRAVAALGHSTPAIIEERTDGTDSELIVEGWADARGLVVTFPDFPSWQNPGRCRLVVFETSEPAEAAPSPTTLEPELDTPTAPPTAPDHDAMRSMDLLDHAGPEPVDVEGSSSPVDVDAASDAEEIEPDDGFGHHTATGSAIMRPIAPLALDGIAPRGLAGEIGPDFDIVAPTDLLIDESYQRGLSPKSVALIRRIVENWSWSRFKAPTCVRVEGQLHVIDGQHTAIAAASHDGITAIPVLVVAVPEVADRAAAFVSHARNRLQATAVQIHRAALVAGDEEAMTVEGVCRAAGVELLPFPPSSSVYAPRQCVAVVGIRRLIAKRGTERAREILAVLAAADLAPIAGDHIRLAEALLCEPAYADGFDADRLTAALRGLTAKTHAEARELAIAKQISAWRALAAVLYRNRAKARPRGAEASGPIRRRAGA